MLMTVTSSISIVIKWSSPRVKGASQACRSSHVKFTPSSRLSTVRGSLSVERGISIDEEQYIVSVNIEEQYIVSVNVSTPAMEWRPCRTEGGGRGWGVDKREQIEWEVSLTVLREHINIRGIRPYLLIYV